MTVPSCIREKVVLAPYTSFGIGGPARWLAEPATEEELRQSLAFARRRGVPVLVMGGGSNLLVSDAGVDALVVRLSSRGEFGAIVRDGDNPLRWRAGAAAGLQALVGETVRKGVAGLEAWAGIPGSVGGAVVMNAGSGVQGIGDFVSRVEARALSGQACMLERDALEFSYRRSNVDRMVATVFEFTFFERDDPAGLVTAMREYRERKRASQPLTVPSSGCIFKNPPGDSAGRLIDLAGCKGMCRGDAQVSAVHANFIVNQGGATCRDVVALACRVRDIVSDKFAIVLEPEVRIWGLESDFDCFRESFHVDK